MSNAFVTIATFASPVDAELAKMRLKAEGISVFLANSLTSGMLIHLPDLASTRLQVKEKDAEQAVAILQSDATDDEKT